MSSLDYLMDIFLGACATDKCRYSTFIVYPPEYITVGESFAKMDWNYQTTKGLTWEDLLASWYPQVDLTLGDDTGTTLRSLSETKDDPTKAKYAILKRCVSVATNQWTEARKDGDVSRLCVSNNCKEDGQSVQVSTIKGRCDLLLASSQKRASNFPNMTCTLAKHPI